MLAAHIHLELLDRVVSSANFLTGGVSECDTAHRRSGAVLCLMDKIKGHADAPSSWFTTPSVCASTGYQRCFGLTSVYICASSLQNRAVSVDFNSPLGLCGVGLAGNKRRANAFLLA